MKIAILHSSELFETCILKPNFHMNFGKSRMRAMIEKGKSAQLLHLLVHSVYSCGIFKRIFVNSNEKGVPYITAQQMMTTNPLLQAKLLSKKYTRRQEEMTLKDKQILVSCAGTVGNVRLISKDLAGNIGSQDIIRVDAKEDNYGFIYAFLASKTCYEYIQSLIYGSVVPRIEPGALANIPVPIFPNEIQQQIHNLITESAELRVKANKILADTEEFFYNYLNIKHSIANKFQTGTRKISEIQNNFQLRFDAPIFINHGVKLIDALKKKEEFGFELLGNCETKVSRPGIFKRIYVKNNGIPYIVGSELGLNNPFANCVYLSKTKTPFLDELKLQTNQILITCAGSTNVGMVTIITKDFEEQEAIGSQDIIRINCSGNLFTNEYVYAYLRLPFVFDFIKSLKYGSAIERIEPFHVDQIPILRPTEDHSKLITQKIMHYKDCVYLALQKENQAIQLVEKEIEQWQQ